MSARTPGIGRVGIWAGNFDALPATELRQASAAIENLGYGALWFPETTGREAMARPRSCWRALGGSPWPPAWPDIYARAVRGLGDSGQRLVV
ncbi:hypothetical protein [Nonomuraea basaltis]|uniref:hypothetical protein n=1 Tax=Nonomuraea basaltis TaxID=2495887 RepID=UPI00110C6030|nr:hypothetical protein [Nonomuraea basaltis]TMR92997.1 hypothetical protein EJK15_41530 [Nonomuraea basaltis]